MSQLQALLTVTALFAFTPGTFAQDAYTVPQSDLRLKLRVGLPVGGPAIITAIDGALSSVATADKKIGISVRILDRDRGTVEIRFWELTKGRNGADAVRSIDKADARVGETIATGDLVRDAVTSVEVMGILDREQTQGGSQAPCSDGGGKCCVRCGGVTVCSYCAVSHDCGTCCAAGCC